MLLYNISLYRNFVINLQTDEDDDWTLLNVAVNVHHHQLLFYLYVKEKSLYCLNVSYLTSIFTYRMKVIFLVKF